ncbi:MAG TPA: DUF5998 family protein [Actinomycetales bacterium]|nr:DUF5998 family protein [Actinomycetales bacterium]
MARRPAATDPLPPQVRTDIERAGYFPELVSDVVASALAGEPVVSHLVHQETTFDTEEVRRHVTVLVLTATRLIVAHADDHGPDASMPTNYAAASTESVPLHQVRSVVVSHLVTRPEQHRPGTPAREVTLTICWGSVTRLDLEPAGCGDPECEADHGYTGTMTSDDIVVRLSAEAEGVEAVQAAVTFAGALSAATGAQAALR